MRPSGYFVSTVGIDESIIQRYIKYQGDLDSGQMEFDLQGATGMPGGYHKLAQFHSEISYEYNQGSGVPVNFLKMALKEAKNR